MASRGPNEAWDELSHHVVCDTVDISGQNVGTLMLELNKPVLHRREHPPTPTSLEFTISQEQEESEGEDLLP